MGDYLVGLSKNGPTSADPIPHLTVSRGATRFSLIVVEPQMTGVGKGTFIVPEPVGASRVLGALFRAGGAKGPTVSLDLFDLTGAPGQTFGGFSMIPFETVEGPGLRCVGGEIIRPLRDLSRLSEPAPVRGATAKNLS